MVRFADHVRYKDISESAHVSRSNDTKLSIFHGGARDPPPPTRLIVLIGYFCSISLSHNKHDASVQLKSVEKIH